MRTVKMSVCSNCHKCDMGKCSVTAMLERIRQPSLYRRGASIFMQGQPATAVFVVCNGRVKHTLSSPYGKSFLVRLGNPGDMMGLADCLLGHEYRGSVTALVDSEVSILARRQFLDLLESSPECMKEISRSLALEFHAICECLENIALIPSVKVRLIRFLQGIRRRAGTEKRLVPFPYTQEQLAEILGCTRETVGRLFIQLTRAGAISRKGASVTFGTHFDEIVRASIPRARNPRCA